MRVPALIRHDLGRLPHDVSQPATHVLCCICFEYVPFHRLWRDAEGTSWDMCGPCGAKEGTP